MPEVDAVHIYNYSNPEIVSFSNGLIHLMKDLPQIEESFYAGFVAAANEFKEKFGETPNKYGSTLKEIDQTNDRLWSNTIKEVKLGLEHPDEARQIASEKIVEAIDDLPNPTKLAYKKEYGWMDKYLQVFDSFDRETLKAAAIDAWVDALREGCTLFAKMQAARTKEDAEFDSGATRNARAALIDAYNDLVRRLEATVVLHPAPAYLALCDQLNSLIKQSNARKTKPAPDNKPVEDAAAATPAASGPAIADFGDDPEDDTVTDVRPRN